MNVEAKEVFVSIGGRNVLMEESIQCISGQITGLVGPSGCGKTTLLHCLGLLMPVDKGKIVIAGKNVTNYTDIERRRFWRDYAAFILQDYGIMDEETVGFNVTLESSFLGKSTNRNKQKLGQILEKTGLSGRENELASHLSGGEKQRLALARAIYKNAKVLFADEPTASLDSENRLKVIKLLRGFASKGVTVVVSTHDTEMMEACDVLHEVGSKNRSNNQLITAK